MQCCSEAPAAVPSSAQHGSSRLAIGKYFNFYLGHKNLPGYHKYLDFYQVHAVLEGSNRIHRIPKPLKLYINYFV